MDRRKTIEILEALASGYSPITGAKLEHDNVLNEREVIRALQVAIDYLNAEQLSDSSSVKINEDELNKVIELFKQEKVKITPNQLKNFFLGTGKLTNENIISNEFYGKYQEHYTSGMLWDFLEDYLAKYNQKKKKKRKENPYKEIDFFQQATFNRFSESAIQQLRDKVNELGVLKTENLSKYVQEARLKYPRAFESWSEKEKELLKKAIEYTNDLDLLASCFQRGKNSIEIYGQKIIYDAQNPQDDSE